MHVLVTDGEQRAALAAVRSLGRAGHTVTVTSSRRGSVAGSSRFAARELRVAEPATHPDEYARNIAAIVRHHDIAVVLPITDESLLALLSVRDSVGAPIPFPSLEQVRAIGDKKRVLDAAASVGVAVPRQWVVGFGGAPPLDVTFPLVVKPHRSVVGNTRRERLRVTYARNHEDLRRRLIALPADAYPLLLQQRIVGPGVGVFVLRWDGRTVAAFSHRRLREKPPSGGVSVYRESIALDPELLTRTERLLDAFQWQGVAMVEYKVDQATATPYLMEINGRLWGSLQLAVDAGVDFPVLLVDAARGRLPEMPVRYRIGVRSRWFWGDVDQLLSRLSRSRRGLALPPTVPGRWRAIGDFMAASLRPSEEEVFRLDDPMPFVRESLDWLRRR